MKALAQPFLDRSRSAERRDGQALVHGGDDEAAALGARVLALHQQGRAAWPQIPLDPLALAAHLAALVPADTAPLAALAEVQAGDLYLACACALGEPTAVAALEQHHLSGVPALLQRGGEPPTVAEEVAQRLRVKLLVDGGSGPRIAAYGGRGPLGAFLRVAALREAISYHREASQRRERPQDPTARERSPAVAALASGALSSESPELRFLRDHHRAAFQEALAEALQALPAADRNLLRLTVVEGLRGEQVAALFGVTRSTVVRWLAAARRAVWEGTRDRLRQRVGVRPEEFESLARVLRSQLELSVARILREDKAE